MTYPTLPHFSMPFRLEGASFAANEQDTAEEVADCVELTLRTVQGERRTLPDFGRPDRLVFSTDRLLAVNSVQQAIEHGEPRARPLVESDASDAEQGIMRLRVMWAQDPDIAGGEPE